MYCTNIDTAEIEGFINMSNKKMLKNYKYISTDYSLYYFPSDKTLMPNQDP